MLVPGLVRAERWHVLGASAGNRDAAMSRQDVVKGMMLEQIDKPMFWSRRPGQAWPGQVLVGRGGANAAPAGASP
jgi:hypothetical protein